MDLQDIIIRGLSFLTLFANIVILAYFFDLGMKKSGKERFFESFWSFIGHHSLTFGLIVSGISMIGSLVLSEVLKFTPCTLCWYQRILMYPIAIMFLVAMIKKDRRVFRYTLPLAILGLMVAAFHYLMQTIQLDIPCSAVGYSVSCSEFFFMQFGYITIPFMALTAFLLLIILPFVNRQ